ncbi:mechanosensitive ion channel, partial [Listeria monocytogenes]|nr:mechanosensitive ion channel [Listeria monocytogenes]
SNHSRGNMRVMVDIQISPHEDPEKAIKIIGEVCDVAAKENKNIVEPPVVLGVQNIDATNMIIRGVGKAVNGEQYSVQRDLRKDIREALAENKIELPLNFVST